MWNFNRIFLKKKYSNFVYWLFLTLFKKLWCTYLENRIVTDFFLFFYKTSLKILEKCTENGLIKKLHPWHWQHSAQLGTIISEIGNCLCILMINILCFDIKLTHKWQFYDHFWRFLCKCMFIFHKTEVQTVILICLMGLNSDWFKNYDTNCKYFHFLCLLHTSKKMKICIFCFFAFFVITLEPIKFKTC